MEYLVTANRPFEAIEAQAIAALQRHGFLVHRTFSLRSATRPEGKDAGGNPGYSVLMLYASDEHRQPLALVTLYEWQSCTVIESLATPLIARRQPLSPDAMDVEAELAAALSMGGLEFCVRTAGGAACLDPGLREEPADGAEAGAPG
jgi:hypothetical protein